jgi:hypothetical protein
VDKITQEEWQGWHQNPVTKEFRQHLRRESQRLRSKWANKQFSSPESNAGALGKVELLQSLLDLDLEDINDKDSED